MAWTTAVLCTDADLLALEHNVLQWVAAEGSATAYRATAKDMIEAELRKSFRALDQSAEFTATDILDLLLDVTPICYPACYLTLHLICNNCSTGNDQWERKAEMYWSKYKDSLPGAIGMLSFDIDESGVIEDAEKYYMIGGVRMTRGSA